MLNRSKLVQELSRASDTIFKEYVPITWLTKEVWRAITTNQDFLDNINNLRAAKQLACWTEPIEQMVQIGNSIERYAVFAVDGSQIYPDPHLKGIECFLINSGACFLSYVPLDQTTDTITSKAQLFSEPKIFVPAQFAQTLPTASFAPELTDLVREAYEFAMMADNAKQLSDARTDQSPFICLFDGNLLFWHLEDKQASVKEFFIKKYLKHLQRLYDQKIIIAGYLSFSKFRDLAQLLNAGLCEDGACSALDFQQLKLLCSNIQMLTDTELLEHVLLPGERTSIFACNTNLVALYPPHLAPHFFYLHVGSEIVRIEIPAWIAQDQALVELVCAVSLDQAAKGNGYPVALAESHAQAVVQGGDRDFFYQMIYKRALAQKIRVGFSQKSIKKKILSI